MTSPISVSDLVFNFAKACRLLVPVLDVAAVPWQEGKQYDSWERVEEALFRTLVCEVCEFEAHSSGKAVHFGRYGFDDHDLEANAKLVVVPKQDTAPWRYVRLATSHQPFDAVRCSREGQIHVFQLKEVDLRFILADQAGETVWSAVRLDL
ncbi:hypothetical protein GCM10011611_18930 [Aliidongia dinghuensis]|uniref:Uncharacterized protein n=1 Tax=Aliidongia dinghuensis TaxID=1867774 RepID=A0A8J2YS95_9PROT|nr:hypothetical protein [Aliidongia dinghuensis]GGF13456.1 hypothetical protein GCM10011611_18930 [Aliidongia dinghuensis]